MTQGDPQGAAGVRQGEILAGRYRVERVLGVGGMGVVVAATHLQLDEKVAIKFLLPAMLRNQEVVGRFAREARAAVKIKSEHVARVSDVGTLENGAPYMVMEFLEGEDLASWIQRQGPLPIEQAVDFVLQASVAVADAHGIGIVHRDLKPANLFCIRRSDGQFVIKVLDFGISKITNLSASDRGGSMTHTAAVMGSPYYMSPEQMQSAKEVDARTDIWALGVIIYELLTGTTPFAGESYAEIAIKVATSSFVPLRSFRPDVPAGLEAVILKCLGKDKNRRYANVAELALALADFSSKRSRNSIERIVGIIQASGLSVSALALPPTPQVRHTPVPPGTKLSKRDETAMLPESSAFAPMGTVAPWSGTMPGHKRKKTLVWVLTGSGVLGVAGLALALRPWSAAAKKTDQAVLADAQADPDACLPNATRCDGVKLRICDSGGKWSAGSLVAGQCGAACSPESSPPQCSGNVPQSCDPTGQWVDGPACKVCSGGACVRVCTPAATQCTSVGEMQTCGADGEWGTPVRPSKSNYCRDGVWVQWKPGPLPRPPGPQTNCDPNYFFDNQGKHFKPECFK